jgi:hypothetical protein
MMIKELYMSATPVMIKGHYDAQPTSSKLKEK